mmetsp:Transcript_41330/g.73310  ORF Transcript_41330/g.73310 Transcript_41330/m.73310 type:complete len:135 (+) Transcript_41330:65-469(+)
MSLAKVAVLLSIWGAQAGRVNDTDHQVAVAVAWSGVAEVHAHGALNQSRPRLCNIVLDEGQDPCNDEEESKFQCGQKNEAWQIQDEGLGKGTYGSILSVVKRGSTVSAVPDQEVKGALKRAVTDQDKHGVRINS